MTSTSPLTSTLDHRVSTRARLLAPAGLAAAVLFGGSLHRAGAQDPQDAQALLTEAAQKMAALETFAFALSTENGETQFVEGVTLQDVTGQVKRPDSFYAEATIDAVLAKITIKMLSVGGWLWYTNPLSADDEFVEISLSDFGGIDPTVMINPDRLILPALDAVQNPVIGGNESLDDVETTRIDGIVDLSSAINASGTPAAAGEGGLTLPTSMPFSAWIDSEKLVRRVALTGAVLQGEASDIVRRVDLSAFNEAVDIQAPNQ